MTGTPWRGPPGDPGEPKPKPGEDRSARIIRLAGDLLGFMVTAMGPGNPADKLAVVGSLYAGILANAMAAGMLSEREAMKLLISIHTQAVENCALAKERRR